MTNKILEKLRPKKLWQKFYEISQIPRPSGKEEKIQNYLVELAQKKGLNHRMDEAKNVLIEVPPSKGYEQAPVVTLQSHTDMVCIKRKSSKHNFERDPIRWKLLDGWLGAKDTTLGADNGIGVAAMLALLEERKLCHGPLELLFTTDEERGLVGAFCVQPSFLKGSYLLNLDSEEEGSVFIGCAGGVDTIGTLSLKWSSPPEGKIAYRVGLQGGSGGHSGLEIHRPRANGIKLLARALHHLWEAGIQFYLAHLEGGSKRNAIPDRAEAVIFFSPADKTKAQVLLANLETQFQQEFSQSDPQLELSGKKVSAAKSQPVLSPAQSQKIVQLLLALPHGVIAFDQHLENFVQTSTNLAIVSIQERKLVVETSQRSSLESAKQAVQAFVRSVFQLAGAKVKHATDYPGWQPNPQSPLLKTLKETHKKLFKREPVVKAIHAGLECGVFKRTFPHMHIASFGPSIEGAHTPEEKVNLASVQRFYRWLKEILFHLAKSKK